MEVTKHSVGWEFVGWQRCVSDGRNALNLGGVLIGIGGSWRLLGGLLVQLCIPADVSYSMLLVSVSITRKWAYARHLDYDGIWTSLDLHLYAPSCLKRKKLHIYFQRVSSFISTSLESLILQMPWRERRTSVSDYACLLAYARDLVCPGTRARKWDSLRRHLNSLIDTIERQVVQLDWPDSYSNREQIYNSPPEH